MTRPMLTAALVALAAVALLVAPRLTAAPQVQLTPAPQAQAQAVVAAPAVPVVRHVAERQRPELLIPEATDSTPIRRAPPPRLALPEVPVTPEWIDGCPPCGMG